MKAGLTLLSLLIVPYIANSQLEETIDEPLPIINLDTLISSLTSIPGGSFVSV